MSTSNPPEPLAGTDRSASVEPVLMGVGGESAMSSLTANWRRVSSNVRRCDGASGAVVVETNPGQTTLVWSTHLAPSQVAELFGPIARGAGTEVSLVSVASNGFSTRVEGSEDVQLGLKQIQTETATTSLFRLEVLDKGIGDVYLAYSQPSGAPGTLGSVSMMAADVNHDCLRKVFVESADGDMCPLFDDIAQHLSA